MARDLPDAAVRIVGDVIGPDTLTAAVDGIETQAHDWKRRSERLVRRERLSLFGMSATAPTG